MKSIDKETLVHNSLFVMFNNFFMLVTSWIISVWVARSLGPANYGVFNMVLWVSGIASWLIGMGMTHVTTKFVAEYNGRNEKEVIAAIIAFVLKMEIILSVIATLILLLLSTKIADYFFSPEETFFFTLAFLGLLPGIFTAILSSALEGLQKFKYFTYANLIITPFSFIAKITVLLLGKGITGLITVMLFFSFVNTIYYIVVLNKEGISLFRSKKLTDKNIVSRIFRYNRDVMAIILMDKIIWDKSENFFLGRLCSATQIGFYNLGFNISQKFTMILPSTFWKVLFPAMSTMSGSGETDKMKHLFWVSIRYLAFTAFPIAIGGAIVSYQLIVFIYGREYIGAQRVLQIMFLTSIITSLSQPGAAVLYGYGKQSFIYKLGFFMAILNIIMDVVIIKKYGAVGAVICYSITTSVGSTIGTIYTCKTMKLKFPFYSIGKIFFSAMLMGIVMEVIILKDGGLVGFIASVIAGIIVYLISSLVLGTFGEDDYELMNKIVSLFPSGLKPFALNIVKMITEFRTETEN